MTRIYKEQMFILIFLRTKKLGRNIIELFLRLSSIPEGSSISPLLFCLFNSPISASIEAVEMRFLRILHGFTRNEVFRTLETTKLSIRTVVRNERNSLVRLRISKESLLLFLLSLNSQFFSFRSQRIHVSFPAIFLLIFVEDKMETNQVATIPLSAAWHRHTHWMSVAAAGICLKNYVSLDADLLIFFQ